MVQSKNGKVSKFLRPLRVRGRLLTIFWGVWQRKIVLTRRVGCLWWQLLTKAAVRRCRKSLSRKMSRSFFREIRSWCERNFLQHWPRCYNQSQPDMQPRTILHAQFDPKYQSLFWRPDKTLSACSRWFQEGKQPELWSQMLDTNLTFVGGFWHLINLN